MTRVNVVPVESLTRQHLISEWREVPRIFALAYKASQSNKPWTHKQPKAYTLGNGHCLWFYDKLGWLAERHALLTAEMLKPKLIVKCSLKQAYPNGLLARL